MIERTVVVGPFQCNCRLIVCPNTGEAALIDPGDEPGEILAALRAAAEEEGRPIRVKHLLHTHAHLDHIGATRDVKEALSEAQGEVVPEIWLHPADEPLYNALVQQGAMFGLPRREPLPLDRRFEDEQDLSVGNIHLSVLHTPGHSPGGVCIRLHEDSAAGTRETLYSGDTLFFGSVGRTDLPGGDMRRLLGSIRNRILTLDDDTRVCPGHGPDTKVGVEKRMNPFLQ